MDEGHISGGRSRKAAGRKKKKKLPSLKSSFLSTVSRSIHLQLMLSASTRPLVCLYHRSCSAFQAYFERFSFSLSLPCHLSLAVFPLSPPSLTCVSFGPRLSCVIYKPCSPFRSDGWSLSLLHHFLELRFLCVSDRPSISLLPQCSWIICIEALVLFRPASIVGI